VITFTRKVRTYNPSADTMTSATETVTGEAFGKLSGALEEFNALGLIGSPARLLVFTPSEYGEFPQNGDTVTWEDETWVVKNVRTLAPDGYAILSYVVIVK
jgi:hypothetical protein